jgi:hypothetical protein
MIFKEIIIEKYISLKKIFTFKAWFLGTSNINDRNKTIVTSNGFITFLSFNTI